MASLTSAICSPVKRLVASSNATLPWRDAASVVFDRPRANQVILQHIDWSDPTRSPYYLRNREFLAEVSPLESCLDDDEDPIQVMFTGTVQPIRELELHLRSLPFAGDFTLAPTVYPDKDFSMIDIIHPSVTKGATLAEWAAFRSIPPSDILAIGDNHNDLEMLNFAGVPVVMDNCVPELKTRGWHVTASNDEDGVAAAIHLFALKETPQCA